MTHVNRAGEKVAGVSGLWPQPRLLQAAAVHEAATTVHVATLHLGVSFAAQQTCVNAWKIKHNSNFYHELQIY